MVERVAIGQDRPLVPVRPRRESAEPSRRCLRGHDMKVAGIGRGWSHAYSAYEVRCQLCTRLRDERASWCEVDPAKQVGTPTGRLDLVPVAPRTRGGIGRIVLHLRSQPIGDIDIATCGPCRRACLEQVRVDAKYRRLGFGRLLVAAALVRIPPDQYSWSTTALDDTVEAQAFWSTVPFPGRLGEPNYCRDMRVAAGEHVEW